MHQSSPAPPPKPNLTPQQVGLSGQRYELINRVREYQWPESWGPRAMVCEFILSNIPPVENWRGLLTVTGYRTAPNPKGSGTAYLSVRWSPDE